MDNGTEKSETNQKSKKRVKNIKRKMEQILKAEAYPATSPASYKINQLVNISYGGLVFKYIDKDENRSNIPKKSISLGSYGFYLEDILPKIEEESESDYVKNSDSVTIEEIDFSNIPAEVVMKIKQMNLTFTELNSRQIFALDRFIREHINHKKFIAMHLSVESQ